MRIRYKGAEPAAPPADTMWQPDEEREIEDKDAAARLLQHPDFEKVAAKEKAPASSTEVSNAG